MLFFCKGTTKEVYRKCDISHLRYLKAEKNKTEAESHFHNIGTAKERSSEKTKKRKIAGVIWV